MEQFTDISIHPRSIAWLVRLDAWNQFEEIVYYNSAILGGYFNTIIPVSPENNLLEGYYQFLIDFDPDIVVLAPEMESSQLDSIKRRFFPFAIVPWSSRSEIASINPYFCGTGMNIGVDIDYFRNKKDDNIEFSVAIYDDIHKEMSKLALVSCGDILPRRGILEKMDEYISVDSLGYRENILSKLLKPECDFESIKSHLTESGEIKPPPNRKELKHIIQEKYVFPLSDPVKILEKCFQLQHHPTFCESFIGLTRYYNNFSLSGLYRKNLSNKEFLPSVVILISDKFCLEEAILFWNLRANMVYVSWLSFSDLENNLNSTTNWLESDFGGAYYATYSGEENIDIAFSTPDSKIGVLEKILNKIYKKRKRQSYRLGIIPRKKLIDYNSIKPSIVDTKVFVSVDNQKCAFIPPFPEDISKISVGVSTVDLKWTRLMMPQIKCFKENLLSSKKLKGFLPLLERVKRDQICMPIWRITHDRYIRFQMDGKETIEFYKPDKKEIIESLVRNAGYSCIKESNAASYHMDFIQRIGSIDKISDYFKNPNLDKLFRLLADNKDRNKLGWVLNHPSDRRTLNHLQLLKIFDIDTPDETQKYFDESFDKLPDEVVDLLKKRILERGFLLKCNSCDFRSWYPLEQVGDFFDCARCYKSQVYTSNPLLLYKLSEVVFQGFKCEMQVPLLALCYIKRMSSKNFEWVPDSDLYWREGNNEKHKNIDILSLVDGKFFIGEAKSNTSIESDQFLFYKKLIEKLPADGIVFATEKKSWNQGTTKQIENLKKIFDGEVIVLTRKELYSLI